MMFFDTMSEVMIILLLDMTASSREFYVPLK